MLSLETIDKPVQLNCDESAIDKIIREWGEYRDNGGKLATKLLTTSTKTRKDNVSYFTKILYLQPANESGINLCGFHGDCAKICLSESGHMAMETIRTQKNGTKTARWKRTHYMLAEKRAFHISLQSEIRKHYLYCDKKQLMPVVRLNGTSDISWNNVIVSNPSITFYDYTKDLSRYHSWLKRDGRVPFTNYHITFSCDEKTTPHMFFGKYGSGASGAVVFDVESFKRITKEKTIEINGKLVDIVNGDISDNRFLDYTMVDKWSNNPILVALKAKGRARKNGLRFVFTYTAGGLII